MAAPYIPSPTAHLSLVFEQGLVCDLAIGLGVLRRGLLPTLDYLGNIAPLRQLGSRRSEGLKDEGADRE